MNERNLKIKGTLQTIYEVQDPSRPERTYTRQEFKRYFSGDLQGTSVGEKLATGDWDNEYAGYVSMETFRGTVFDKEGSFDIMCWGTYQCGSLLEKGEMVGGSGTGDFEVICGYFSILWDRDTTSFSYEVDLNPSDYSYRYSSERSSLE